MEGGERPFALASLAPRLGHAMREEDDSFASSA